VKIVSTNHTKRIVIGLTLLLFVLGYSLIVLAGISGVRHLRILSILMASYLVVWGGYSLTSPIPRDEIRSQFVLMTLSLGFALLLAELPAWLKLIDYRKTFSISSNLPWEQPGYLLDSELLAKPEPHHSVTMLFNQGNIGETLCLPPRQAEPFELRYDKNGFRNDQDLTSAEIAVIGDSYIESPMIPGSLLATTRLAEIQSKTVANLGQAGYGPQQELAVLKRYALPLHPKYVVWVFYEGNDLLDALGYAEKVSFLNSHRNSIDTVWNRSLTKSSMSWMVRLVRGCVPEQHLKASHATVLDDEGKEHRVYFKGYSASASLTTQEIDALKQSVAAIEEAYRLVQNEGARFIVVFAPTAFRVYHDIVNFDTDEGNISQWELNDLPDRFRKMIYDISPDVGYLDLTPAFKSALRKNSLVFLSDDTHWSSDGHRVVAEALAGALTVGTQRYAEKQPPEIHKMKGDIILSRDAIMVRNADGSIRYWSEGAQKLYGWEPQEVLGATSHRLLKTVFPVPLEVIDQELRTKGHWEGQLIHERRDGSKITVASHWDLQQNPRSQDQSITVIEINARP
jgi:PAS domain S-box-containing protein